MPNIFTRPLIFTLMLAVFLDIGNFFMPMPIYSPLFLHSSFLHGYSHEARAIMLGVLMALYGVAQLFGAPIFAEFSDQHGRRKAILLSMVIALAGCILAAISITYHSIPLVYISRLMIGFGSGTIAVVFAVTADLSNESNRAKHLGFINTGLSIGAAVGPVIGGHLVYIAFAPKLGYAGPFYCMALLYLINICLVAKLLPYQAPARQGGKRIHLFTSFQNIYIVATRSPLLLYTVLMAVLFQIGVESFYLAAPVVGVQKFHMTAPTISNFFLGFGMVAAVVSWWLNKVVSKHFTSTQIYLVCVFLSIFTFVPLITASSYWMFFIPFAGVGVFSVLAWVHVNNLFSQAVDESEQGLIFGVSQSMWSLGGMIGTTLVGVTAAKHYQIAASLPVGFTILCFIVAICMAMALVKSKQSRLTVS